MFNRTLLFKSINLVLPLLILVSIPKASYTISPEKLWEIQAVDTMKVSRDTARENMSNEAIRAEIRAIKEVGATHVGIATPYDEEFYPLLQRWVDITREEGLLVWFRGNFSGWEGWFGYPKDLTREQHLSKTKNFILSHPNLFQDGDSFSPCPECENGGDGDPRFTRDFAGFNQFLVDQREISQEAFKTIDKDVHTNWFSMNGDIAREVLTPETVAKTGGIVTVDHYVGSLERMERDLINLHEQHNAKIILGEFGAPIPDLQGDLTENEQAAYVDELFQIFYRHRDKILGMNYWTGRFASTSIFNPDLSPRLAAEVVKSYFSPGIIEGTITDDLDTPLQGISISTSDGEISTTTNKYGNFTITIPPKTDHLLVSHNQYHSVEQPISIAPGQKQTIDITLTPLEQSLFYKIRLFFRLLTTQKSAS